MNVTQIVDALVDAEKVPQEARIQEQLDERNISISSLGDVKSDLSVFEGNLDVYMGETGLIESPIATPSASPITAKLLFSPLLILLVLISWLPATL